MRNSNHNNTNYNDTEQEYKTKAQRLAKIVRDKIENLTKIEFRLNGKLNAVYLTEEQLHAANKRAKLKGMALHQYYINKYSRF